MRVALRADASATIGLGHVMRCLTLADELAAGGAEVRFLCRDLPGDGRALVAARGHAVDVLPGAGEWNEDGDAAACLAAMPHSVDWLAVDHYALGAAWEGQMRARAARILAIDDLADRRHDCELLLDQNLQADGRYAGLLPAASRLLAGPAYALLRPQFGAARQGLRQRDGRVRRLLLFYGGGDASGETLKALAAVDRLGWADLEVDVVLGAVNPHRDRVEAACCARPGCRMHVQTENMAGLMAAADLALAAGGSASLERCCVGLPALVTAVADNQVEPARALAEAGCQLYLGRAEDLTIDAYAERLSACLQLPEWLGHMSQQGLALVDGRGTGRVARHLLAGRLRLRQADLGDSDLMLAWRNHAEVRRQAFDPRPIDVADHERWLAAALLDPARRLLIAEEDGVAVGVLRYDLDGEAALVTIYLAPERAGRGLGTRLLLAGDVWLRRECPGTTRLTAEIRASNAASLGAFRNAGFVVDRAILTKELHVSV